MPNYILPKNLDLNNPEFQTLWQLINTTNRSVFLTGKAGTGKSTFLKYICNNIKKKYVVLAPTGIAAVNVGGMTLHSFFKIPLRPIVPDAPEFKPTVIRETQQYTSEKLKLFRELELIIIDEISMVRADIIDFIDKILRIFTHNLHQPFGGKQILFVGDVFQLEPVTKSDERDVLSHYYKNFFFFNANVFQEMNLVPIELRKIYRQKNPEFVALLDKVRDNSIREAELAPLNKRYIPNFQQDVNSDEFQMTLATRRDLVDSINEGCLNALSGAEYIFEGIISGDFPENSLPTSRSLALKVGAQVIFVKNDPDGRWVNGTLGKIVELEEAVRVQVEKGDTYLVEPTVWQNVKYTFDEKTKKVNEELLGEFTQLPIKPAWALTIHKSQGLTFNNIIINLGRGAFTSGQTYVALSRCTSLEGITLTQPISGRDIRVNPEITQFSRNFNNQTIIDNAIRLAKADATLAQAANAFNQHDFAKAIELFNEGLKTHNILEDKRFKRLISFKLYALANQQKTIESVTSVPKEISHEPTMQISQNQNVTPEMVREALKKGMIAAVHQKGKAKPNKKRKGKDKP